RQDAETDAEIEFFPDGIGNPVVQGEIQFEAGILFQQCADQWCDMSPPNATGAETLNVPTAKRCVPLFRFWPG
ncbi:hypothetical protein, partial [Pseudomonas aeruginosa]|uniref:hypothetical protein n=1 Tax=Pseudomonas aeruginosa TaxID=287 RepID=UPI003D290644